MEELRDVPALQVQSTAAVVPVGELELAGQARHAAADVAAVVEEYVPGPQSMHAAEPVTLLYFPGTHTRHTGQNPVTWTSARESIRLGPYIEMCRYLPVSGVGHVTSVM